MKNERKEGEHQTDWIQRLERQNQPKQRIVPKSLEEQRAVSMNILHEFMKKSFTENGLLNPDFLNAAQDLESKLSEITTVLSINENLISKVATINKFFAFYSTLHAETLEAFRPFAEEIVAKLKQIVDETEALKIEKSNP